MRFSNRPFDGNTPDSIRDRWQSPLKALAAGVGDCKNHSMIKYAALLEAGFSPDDLRIVVGRIKSVNEIHAVVAARLGKQWYAFDNRSLAVVESGELRNFEAMFVLDDRGVRQFVTPASQIAGAPWNTRVQ